MLDSLSGDLREHMYFHMRESFNFMKHGAKDADETLNFNPTETEWLIYSACVDYLAAFGVAPPEALLFLTYMTDQTPALIRHDVEDPFVSLRQKHRKRTHGARMERRHVARMLAELDELAKDLRARRVKDHPLLRN
jgi:hypothetical protein